MLYRFAHWTLDTQLHTLCREGQIVILSPKVFEVLCYLIAHRERVVSKQELCDNVWQGLAISDATLESCIRTVRASVGDSGQAQQIIQTQRGFGYRFMAVVDTLPAASPEAPAPTASPAALEVDKSAEEQTLTAPASPPSLLPAEGAAASPLPGMRPCGVCAHANREDATFCAACGTRLRQRCAFCGQHVALPAVFCIACGQPLSSLPAPDLTTVSPVTPWLSAATAPSHQASFSAERKPVTVLCCTVSTVAAPAARVDLDALHSLMQALHDLARDVVQQYGGWLQPVLGDRLLIAFGVPVAQEDHARRAVQVALALRQRGHELRQHFRGAPGVSLALRMGLYTGLVVESRWDDTASAIAVVGDVTSLAVALQAQAEPGQILCSDATAHLVRETVRLEAVRPVQVTKQTSPITAYAVIGSRAQRTPRGQPHEGRVLSPFVGREREMATLHALLAQVKAGRGQVVRVVGEAGIGKSRFVSEFYQELRGRQFTYVTGRCLSYGSATPYLPWLDLLRHNCGLTEDDGPEDITAKVYHSLQEVDMPPETWAPVFLSLLGVQESMNQLATFSPETRKARILTAFTQLCINGSRQRPLVLEIEDLHWIDASSEECLAMLVERMAGMPLLLLVTSRPGYRPAWSNQSYVTQVSLQPLSSQDSLRVVQAVLPTAVHSPTAMSHLLAKAEGNPFFLEELAQMVVERGTDVPSATVPDTVQAVLMARIDRLPASAKLLLQAAAVIGKDIALPLLQAVTAMPEEAMHRELSSLEAAEFLYETYVHAAPIYTFKHVLTQEVAYQSLVRRASQQYHERIAQVLEEQFPEVAETQPELLAYHYTEADRGAQAIPYWLRAGQRAVERSANLEAISHFRRGLEVLAQLPDTPERIQHELALYVGLGPPLFMIKGQESAEVVQVYNRARELCQQVGDSRQRFAVLLGLSQSYNARGNLQMSWELGERSLAVAQDVRDPVLQHEAYVTLGAKAFSRGEFVVARTHLEQGLALGRSQGQRARTLHPGSDSEVTGATWLAWTLWMLGYPDRALAQSRAVLHLAQTLGHAYSLAYAFFFAALLHQCRREPSELLAQLDTAVAVAQEQGFGRWVAGGQMMRGWALAQQGAVEEGIAQIQQGLTTWRTLGNELALPHYLTMLAEAYGQGGEIEAGLCVLTDAQAIVDKNLERRFEAEIWRLKGALLLQHMQAQDSMSPTSLDAALVAEVTRAETPEAMPLQAAAEHCLLQAIHIARQQQAKCLELRAIMRLVRLWQIQGKRAESCQMLAESYGWFTEGFDTPDLREAQALLRVLQ